MPDTARRGVYYRFRDHVVTGVNWRRTRLVDEIPSVRVCCVCRTIPRRTVLLSCLHALCEDCHATNGQARSALCPLDQEPSEEDECVVINFPSRKAESVKVYCWNENQGCEYVGNVGDMLRHYENECPFHTVECSTCNGSVLHKDILAHQAARCSVSNASTTRNHSSSVSTELTTQSLNAPVEDLKTFLRDSQLDQLLPAIQSQMNELTEHVRNQEVSLAGIARQIRAFEEHSQADGIAVPIPSSTLNPRSCRQMKSVDFSALQCAMTQSGPPIPAIVARCQLVATSDEGSLSLTNVPSTSSRWLKYNQVLIVTYMLTLDNAEGMFACYDEVKKLAEVTVPHMSDTDLSLTVTKRKENIELDIQLDGKLAGSQCFAPPRQVTAWHPDSRSKNLDLKLSFDGNCSCVRFGGPLGHLHHIFCADLDLLKNTGFLRDGKMVFKIEIVS